MSTTARRPLPAKASDYTALSGPTPDTLAGTPLPRDWSLVPLGELCFFANGVNADKSAYGAGVPFINVLEVITNTHIREPDIPGRIRLSKSMLDSFAVRRGDVLFNRTSETQEEVGLSAVYDDDATVVFGGFVIRGRFVVDELMDSTYVGYGFRAPAVRAQIVAQGQGAIRSNIGQANLKRVLIPIPPKHEQRAIAKALSDVDGLLGALEALIAKKRAIKQAAMRELLTGKTRLSGFSGKWEQVRLGDLFDFKNGLNKAKKFFGHGTPIVNYMDVFQASALISTELPGRVQLSRQEIQNFDVRQGDVFFTRTSETTADIGIAAVMLDEPTDTVFSGFVLRARPKNHRICDEFKAYCFACQVIRSQIVSTASYTTRALTNGKLLSRVSLMLPPRAEQMAIATLLSDMDAELTALERRRDKTRAIKQGMLQQLLTGRVRLVEPGPAEPPAC